MELVILIGLQGAGKSTFYHTNFANSHLRLNYDMLKTRHREQILWQACLASKTKIVLDNTNPTPAIRKPYIDSAKACHYKVIAYYFDVAFETALANNNERTGKAKIPEIGLKAVTKQLTKPTFDEGFDRIYVVKNDNHQFIIQEQQCDLTI